MQLILRGDIWRSVWRICMWILELRVSTSIRTLTLGTHNLILSKPTSVWEISCSCTIRLKFPSVLNNWLPYNNTQITINNNISGLLCPSRSQTVQASRFCHDSPNFFWKSWIPTSICSRWQKSWFRHLFWYFQMNSYDTHTRTPNKVLISRKLKGTVSRLCVCAHVICFFFKR